MYMGHMGPAYGGIYGLCNQLATEVPCTSILDLGARHGEGFVLFGSKTHQIRWAVADQHCELYVMVEPSPRCIPKIQELIGRHTETSIELIPGVLGRVDGAVELIMFDADNDQSANTFTTRGGQYGPSTSTTVPVFSYDHGILNNRHFDIAKVNIEGGEYQLIDDGYFTPARIGAFVMEAHNAHVPGRTYKDVIAALGSQYDIVSYGDLNYKYCFLVGTAIS